MMQEELENIELIEQYVEGKMSSEDISFFEARLLKDDKLRNELELYQKISSGLKTDSSDSLRKKLKEIDRELDKKKATVLPIKKNEPKKYYSLAAIILLFIISASYLLFFRNSDDKLIAQYDEQDAGLPVLMSTDADVALSNAMNAYKLGQLDSSLALINELLKNNPSSDTLNYYDAVISEQLKKYDQAIINYQVVLSTKNSAFNFKSAFHLGITYWKNKDLFDAKRIFSIIASDSGNPYQKKAEDILKKM